MSIFSSIRRSRQQAKEHSAKMAEQKQKESETAPYRHVPTHAALDAIASAPPSWRESDRSRIQEANRRRSAMPAHAQHASMPSIPRVGSSLSHVSYPANYASPVVRVPRTYSYTGGLTPYADRSRDIIYSVSDEAHAVQPTSWKGKEVTRPGLHIRGISPTSSKAEQSPVHSSSGSTSSQDDLEMRVSRPLAQSAASSDNVHRLHPSSRRRSSETSTERRAASSTPIKAPGSTSASRDSRPPPSMRGFNHIPTYTGQSPTLTGAPPGSLSAYQLAGGSSRRNSATSLSSPLAGQVSVSNPASPMSITPTDANFSFGLAPSLALEGSYFNEMPAKSERTTPLAPSTLKDPRVPKTARFVDLERIDSLPESTHTERSRSIPQQDSSPKREQIINVLPEPMQPLQPEPLPAKTGKKLSKGSGKLVKKDRRWSLSKTPQIAT